MHPRFSRPPIAFRAANHACPDSLCGIRLCVVMVCGVWVCGAAVAAAAEPVPNPPAAPEASGPEDRGAMPFRVGVAKIDITPDQPVMLSGYAARGGALVDRVEQPISARALVIDPESAKPVVLVSIDLCGVPRSLVGKITAAVEQRHGVDRARIAVSATHTHSAPMVSDLLMNIAGRELSEEELQVVERYTQSVMEKTVAVVDAAFRGRVPARLEWGTSRVGFAINRRSTDGPVDHDLPVLVVRDEQNQPLGIVAGYACHCTTLGPVPFISGDWAGSAVEAIEADFPGATALMLIGCGGDQNPNPAIASEQSVARLHGRAVADAVARRIAEGMTAIEGDLQVAMEEIQLPLQALPSLEMWEQRAATSGIEALHAAQNLRRLQQGQTLPTAITYPIQTWAFGDDLAMTFLGGEVVVDYALALKATHGSRLWVTAYTNDVACYIPSEEVLSRRGYEGESSMLWYDLPAPLAPGLQSRIEATVARQLPPAYRASEQTAPHDSPPHDSPPQDSQRTGGKRPLSPAESIARMQTHDDLRVELVVAEPLVIDPVAIDFAADGRLWVAEMRDYPEGLDGHYQPGGRIRLLHDTDGDGRYDRADDFLQDIPFPTGLMAWRGGVLVAAAPEVFYAEDTDGDGRADRRTPVLSGFETHNYQARVNSLSLGLDNWVYAAGGLFGGQLQTPGGHSVDVGNRDLRLLPDQAVAKPVTGRTQQGRVRDDWGNWFGCTNSVVLSHYPHVAHYLRRNPLLVAPPAERYVPRGTESQQLFPRGELVQFSKSGPSGRPTSVCGLGIYRDQRLGSEYYGNAFVCEPVNQLIHRLILSPAGVTFEGRRADDEQTREFLTSTDNWFRPVQVRTGPDGALWVVDMYRYVIEHPRFISDEVRSQLDIRSGDLHGRIYRIVPRNPAGQSPAVEAPAGQLPAVEAAWAASGLAPHRSEEGADSDDPSTARWLAAMASPNGTLRDMAHAHLLWREDAAVAGGLGDLVRSSPHPQVRVQALCLLDGLDALAPDDLLRGLRDAHPAVRAHAVRLTERLPKPSPEQPSPEQAVTSHVLLRQMIAEEQDPSVRLQLAYTVGEWSPEERVAGLLRMLERDAADADLRAAIFSGLRTADLRDFTGEVLRLPNSAPLWTATEELVSMVAASGDDRLIGGLVTDVLRSEQGTDRQMALLPPLIVRLDREDLAPSPPALHVLDALRSLAGTYLATEDLPEDRLRLATGFSASFLHWIDHQSELEGLENLLAPWQPSGRQMLAIEALARAESATAHDALLAHWGELTPAMRAQAFNAMLTRPSAMERLLAALESGTIRGSQLDAQQRQALAEHPDGAIRERAAAQASSATAENRQQVLSLYQNVDPARGDLRRGAAVFEQHCAACHRFQGVGLEVGPDLAALSDRSTEFLLAEILDPNRAVDGRYATYVALTDDGRMLSGILASEQDGSITLKGQQAESTTLRRGEIAELVSHGTSLMPEGLERVIPPEAMDDLVAYLQSLPGSR